ncbi:post-GPI attachment to proteins factor 4-like [Mya arenaria]|uniref:post-GPI attachment to proteins factor 4-like n=1 Tax=Mya arenaria TaxID=6604 RepID=UPI0022E812C0|nr:post-GPI attachment to proteins factor 4-like [Mya arenaria]
MDSAIGRSRGDREYGLLICNADSQPGKHQEALELRDFALYVDKEHTSNFTGQPPRVPRAINSGLKDTARIQEINDYVFCLNASMALKYKHVLVLEDDVLPINNLLQTLDFIILRRLRNTADDSAYYGMTKPFLYLKLYYPQRWQGFAYEIGIMLEFLSIGVVVGGIVVCLDTLCGSRNRRKGHTLFIFVVFTAFALCLAKCLGRVNINDVRRLSPQLYRFGRSAACCTQAMLYPRGAIYPLMEHLLVNNSLNKDLSIHRFSEISGYPGYQVEPNLFQHIGMHTSLSGGSDKNPEEFLFKLHESTFK